MAWLRFGGPDSCFTFVFDCWYVIEPDGTIWRAYERPDGTTSFERMLRQGERD